MAKEKKAFLEELNQKKNKQGLGLLNAAGGSMIHKPFSKMHHLGVGTNVNNSNVNPLALSAKGKIY